MDVHVNLFFKNLSSTVGGSTPSNSRLASHTLANCLTATTITPDISLATNTTTMSNNQYKKIVKGECQISEKRAKRFFTPSYF